MRKTLTTGLIALIILLGYALMVLITHYSGSWWTYQTTPATGGITLTDNSVTYSDESGKPRTSHHGPASDVIVTPMAKGKAKVSIKWGGYCLQPWIGAGYWDRSPHTAFGLGVAYGLRDLVEVGPVYIDGGIGPGVWYRWSKHPHLGAGVAFIPKREMVRFFVSGFPL